MGSVGVDVSSFGVVLGKTLRFWVVQLLLLFVLLLPCWLFPWLGYHLCGAGASHVPSPVRSQAQRWRNENYERPVDLEGSGDDDPFGEDELDDVYSGSGSGCE